MKNATIITANGTVTVAREYRHFYRPVGEAVNGRRLKRHDEITHSEAEALWSKGETVFVIAGRYSNPKCFVDFGAYCDNSEFSVKFFGRTLDDQIKRQASPLEDGDEWTYYRLTPYTGNLPECMLD